MVMVLTGTCAEFGRTDVESTRKKSVFTPTTNSSFESFNITDDSVLEFDELLIATFEFGKEIANNWNVRKGTPSTTYIAIIDNECEYNLTKSNHIHSSDLILLFFLQLWR